MTPVLPNFYQRKSYLSAFTPRKKWTRITNLDPGNTIVSYFTKLPNCTAATLSSECSTNIHIYCLYWYWLLSFLLFFSVRVAFWQLDIKRRWRWWWRWCQLFSGISGRRYLRSADRGHLDFSRVKLASYGRHSFAYAGPSNWNSLPAHIRDNSLSLSSFRRHLKTFLFSFY